MDGLVSSSADALDAGHRIPHFDRPVSVSNREEGSSSSSSADSSSTSPTTAPDTAAAAAVPAPPPCSAPQYVSSVPLSDIKEASEDNVEFLGKREVKDKEGKEKSAAYIKPKPYRSSKYRHVAAYHTKSRDSCLSRETDESPSFIGFRNLMVLVLGEFENNSIRQCVF